MRQESLRILMDARMITPKPHGIARYVIDLTRALGSKGHRVSLLTHSDYAKEAIGADFIADQIPCRIPFANPLEVLELSQKARAKDFDVIHFPSFALPLRMPPNAVVTIHDLIHLYPPGRLSHKIYYQTVVRTALSQSKKIIAVSDWTRKDLIQKLGIEGNRIQVVRNGVDASWLSPAEAEISEQANPFILCLSNPKPHKNLQTLIKACQSLWRKGENFVLTLSLGGVDLPSSWNLSETDRNHIHLLRSVSDEQLKKFIKGCALLVSPSLREGFNYPAAEALVAGTPVLLSLGSAHGELRGDRLIFYSPPEDPQALEKALSSALKEDLRNRAKTHNIHSLEQMAAATLGVYRQVVSPSR